MAETTAAPVAPAAHTAPLLPVAPVQLNEVVLDGLVQDIWKCSLMQQVVLKIIKHCRENLPALVTGQLLGLDFDGSLQVTNCFPFPQPKEDSGDDVGAEYQVCNFSLS